MLDLIQAQELAIDAAMRAGEMLKQKHEELKKEHGETTLNVTTKSSPIDFVTEVDRGVQHAIIEQIQAVYPTHRFFAEEEGAEGLGDSDSPYTWIIDPLDGTTNFIREKPAFGTMIGLQENDELILGIIHRPMFDEISVGMKGKGATINGSPIVLRNTKNMTDAVLCTTIMKRAEKQRNGSHTVTFPYCTAIENCSNAAQEIAEVLLGKNDGAFFRGVGLWDIAAGCFLAEEAGGKSRWEFLDANNPREGVRCVISTEKIFDELCEFVFDNDCFYEGK